MGSTERVINLLNKAEDAGAGGKQREILEYAIRLLARDFTASMVEAGNGAFVARDAITEIADSEAAYATTGR